MTEPEFAPRYPVVTGADFTTASFGRTPSQTVGPYVHIGLLWPDGEHVVPPGSEGAVDLTFTLIDGSRNPVTDAMIETWQADADGRFDHPDDPRGAVAPRTEGFRGFGRAFADETGTMSVTTIKPGPLPAENGTVEAPHIDVGIFARGMLERLVTRMYFPDEIEANEVDPVLAALPEHKRARLVARAVDGGYHLDIVVQNTDPDGDETPFFAL
ncbi:Protocatechuate 3,4-dioxygenase alpha subunit PcaG [Rhodococcus sp. AW25M09]|uniref:protocatechuate 3,4-dioxygenase subunit alpha n=1 Tax=Rhodococcus sp. AW25M09 TaxID=1268303 RepID=UPI0002ACBAFA|nr:protocatechuate 3,4-dioxygenase subunit alpha [Rhodococcus sp. AW25M09]CCQ15967.1 Protocatechuate 3,4-dioxygenase alpha subunit PcaG [Rhodococcus sp. AW25M09]